MLQADTLKIEISKMYYEGSFTHWEWDLTGPDGAWLGGGTGPNFHAVLDEALLWETTLSNGVELGNWMSENANERGNDE